MWDLVTGLFFPSKDQEWRKSVSFLICIFGGMTIMNTWVMFGLFPVSLVFSGFATAGDLEKQTHQIEKVQKSITEQTAQNSRDKNELKALMLLGQLNQLYDSFCGARRNGRNEEAVQWERQFFNTLVEYNRVSAQPYPMRSCG